MNKNITIDSLDTPNPRADHDGPWSIAPRPTPRLTWDVIVARWGMGMLAAGAAWWVAPEWAHAYVTAAALGLGTLAGAKHILTDMIGGVAVRTWRNDVRATDIVAPLGQAAVEHARRPLPNVSSYSPTLAPAARGPVIEGAVLEQPAQLAPPLNVGPLAPEQWLAWLDAQPHAIFAAKTGGGKSTIAKYGLLPRINGGESVFIIDPHSSGWFDLPGVGGGEDWQQVEAAMMAVYAEYKRRLRARDEYKRETGQELADDHFPRITVVFDEANNAKAAFDRIYSGARRRFDPWPLFAQCLGSGARKVSMSVWMLVQSPLVEDLGLSGGLRENFTRIALDINTIRQMLRDESNKERREAIQAALVGATYPATAVISSEVYLLDRTGLDQPPMPRQSAAAAWDGWDYAQNTPTVPSTATMPVLTARVAASVRPSAIVAASMPVSPAPVPTDGRTDGRTALTQDRALVYLRARIRQGDSRERARAWMEARGLTFQNSLYTEARRLEGNR